MVKTTLLGVLGAGLLAGSCAAVAGGGGAAPPEIEVLAPLHFKHYVLGFPLHVALTIRAAPHVSFSGLRFPDFVRLRQALSLELQREDAPGHHAVQARPMIQPEDGVSGARLEAGEERRMLVDLSPLLPPDLPAGRYRLTLAFVTPEQESFSAPPVVFELRQPTATETARRAALAPDRKLYATWGEWSVSCPSSPPAAVEAADRMGPLGFVLVLRQLMCGSAPANAVALADLDGLPLLYDPERDVLKAELLRSRQDVGGYAAQRATALAAAPGLAWWLRRLDGGGAYLATYGRRP